MCADVSQYRTAVPDFDFYANEENDGKDEDTISVGMSNFLHNTMPSGSKKRCVYRGAGSICKRNFTDLDRFIDDDADDSDFPTKRTKIDRQKLITCAPNFYCAEFSDNHFNDQVVRDVSNNGLILYGQDADVLGRPISYVGGGESLSVTFSEQNNLVENFIPSIKAFYRDGSTIDVDRENDISGWGVCRPGKQHGNADASYLEQHEAQDPLRRADYVSQVSTCNPDQEGIERVVACPILDMRAFLDDKATKENGNFLDYIFYGNKVDIPDTTDTSIVVTTFDRKW